MTMEALARLMGFGWRVRTERVLADPEPLEREERPTVGLWATLSATQREELLKYSGCETHGDSEPR